MDSKRALVTTVTIEPVTGTRKTPTNKTKAAVELRTAGAGGKPRSRPKPSRVGSLPRRRKPQARISGAATCALIGRWHSFTHCLESRREQIPDFPLCFRIAYSNEVPLLAIAWTRCTSGGVDHALDQVLRHRIGLQVARRTASMTSMVVSYWTVQTFGSLKTTGFSPAFQVVSVNWWNPLRDKQKRFGLGLWAKYGGCSPRHRLTR